MPASCCSGFSSSLRRWRAWIWSSVPLCRDTCGPLRLQLYRLHRRIQEVDAVMNLDRTGHCTCGSPSASSSRSVTPLMTWKNKMSTCELGTFIPGNLDWDLGEWKPASSFTSQPGLPHVFIRSRHVQKWQFFGELLVLIADSRWLRY
jgi:hypothetical protein